MKVIYNDNIKRLLSGAHLLTAGTTGSGKTVVLNNIIYQLIQKPPSECALVLVDPKRVGLSRFKTLPHVINYTTESEQAVNCLDLFVNVMENRYKNIERGNVPRTTIYIIIDELADLMLTSKKDVMPLLQRLLQLGRESKIKVIAATQAPSRKIIPAELTLNFDNRLALRCISPIESRQIIGTSGAECLPRYGSGIMRTSEGTQRIQIEKRTDQEIKDIIDFWL